MKFVKLILNLIMFVFVLLLTWVAAFAVQWVLCVQTGNADNGYVPVSIKEDSVGYNDAFGYLGTSVQANYATYGNDEYQYYTFKYEVEEGQPEKTITADVRGPKYRCRNWFSWNWWKNSLGLWLDYGVDAVASVSAPIILPTSNIQQLQKYYGKQLYEFRDEINTNSKQTYGDTGLTYYEVAIAKLSEALLTDSEYTYAKWVDDYTLMYNYMFKIAKYNATMEVTNENDELEVVPVYESYYNKFIGSDGQPKTSIYLLYYTIILSLIISLWIVHQYPVVTTQNEFGEVEVSGGLFRRKRNKEKKRHFFHRKHKKDN